MYAVYLVYFCKMLYFISSVSIVAYFMNVINIVKSPNSYFGTEKFVRYLDEKAVIIQVVMHWKYKKCT